MFTFTDHIYLSGPGLALDPPRRAPFAFVSHAHSDHLGRHLGGFATPATVALAAARLGRCRLGSLRFEERIEKDGYQIWLAPAGHVLGAAQVVVEGPDSSRLVYTGDFSVRPRPTVATATPIPADVLIMECTFGLPRYVFPPDAQIRDQLRVFVERAHADRVPPVILGYALGKAQEAMALLFALGFRARVHPSVAALAAVYGQHGVELGPYGVYRGFLEPGEVLIAPPSVSRGDLPSRARTLYLSGWAMDRSAKYRLGVDEVLPLSDHADFDELVSFVEQVQPRRIFTTHGPAAFADHLRRQGYDARHLGDHQPALF